jgi:predicted amidophosphoribosyltransferase
MSYDYDREQSASCDYCGAEVGPDDGTCWDCRGRTDDAPSQRICDACGGTALSPYDDGGSCPHCWGGYLR